MPQYNYRLGGYNILFEGVKFRADNFVWVVFFAELN